MKEFTAFANSLADTSGPILRKYFRSGCAREDKADLSPVTLADREAEAALRELIHSTYPQHGFLGEESGSISAEAEYCWVIDPIDGTKNFITGKPIFGTLIALIHHRVPVLGIIDCPLTQERWLGSRSTFTVMNNQPVSVDRNHKPLNECILSTTSPLLFKAEQKGRFERLLSAVKYATFGSDCYAYGLLASGHLDLVVESGLKTHDVMALVPIIEGAGGILTDWQGKPIRFGQEETDVLAAANTALHTQALSVLHGTHDR